ncbi:hypothetical protein C1I98_13040 [Spongiactinospora gelatinilytica]|uniref:Protein kinase domain-containing protein n=1 Tax=Spongiactinospora gelatinilytica TaxID=2666298 RepID=A0A2W2H7T7_9ACTN|nr:serine/threonine-protein kinase [Spongiactinospora gelatinilytica]PZG48005.1 hypothetical protein C1I98_13040 [Spongiactinospora gelatinilytica]
MSDPLHEGHSWIGDHRLIRQIGDGGQGVVHLAHAPSGEEVAIKLLHLSLAHKSDSRRRFLREVETARRVAPFCTARVLGMGLHDGRPYIVSEYIPGVSLEELVRTEGPRSGGGLDRLAVTTISALAAIHRAGIIHRDFKPSNVIMGPEGPVVIDFGIARALDHTSPGTRAIGTPAYMAPELFTDAPPGFAVDIFAWGCTMAYAASGQQAFARNAVPAVMHAILHAEPDLSGVPDALRPLLARCLAKDPDERPTAVAVYRALTGESDPDPDSTGPTASGPLRGMSRRRALVVGGLAGGVAAAAGAISVPPLVSRLTAEPTPGPATTGRTGSAPPFGRLLMGPLVGHTKAVRAVATTVLGGTPVALSGGEDRTVRVFDLAERRQIGNPFTRHTGPVRSIAVSGRIGEPTVVSASDDRTVRAWELRAFKETGPPYRHRGQVKAVATGRRGGEPIAISGGEDRALHVWDLAEGRKIYARDADHSSKILSVAYGERNFQPLAVTGSEDGTLRIWELADGRPIGDRLIGHTGQVRTVDIGHVDGTLVALSGGLDGTVRVWRVDTHERLGSTLTGHRGTVWSVAFAEVDGVPLVVSGGEDGTVRVWNLRTMRPVGKPFTGHTGRVWAVCVGWLNDVPIVVSGGQDHGVRVWSLAPPFP